jgi:hypothetical protein
MHLRYTLLALICLWLPCQASAEFYRYTDKNGVVHFTDDLAQVPEDQRPDVRRYSEPDDLLTPQQRAQKARQKAVRLQEAATASVKKKVKKEAILKTNDRSVVARLNKIKAALDEEHAGLVKEKETLVNEKDTLMTPANVRAYQSKATRLNERIAAYEERRKAFQEEVDAFNAGTRE